MARVAMHIGILGLRDLLLRSISFQVPAFEHVYFSEIAKLGSLARKQHWQNSVEHTSSSRANSMPCDQIFWHCHSFES